MDKLLSFVGYCRTGINQLDVIEAVKAESAAQCHKKCLAKVNECVAFAYTPTDNPRECDLYRGGPYTQGSHKAGSTCYPLIGICNLSIEYLPQNPLNCKF